MIWPRNATKGHIAEKRPRKGCKADRKLVSFPLFFVFFASGFFFVLSSSLVPVSAICSGTIRSRRLPIEALRISTTATRAVAFCPLPVNRVWGLRRLLLFVTLLAFGKFCQLIAGALRQAPAIDNLEIVFNSRWIATVSGQLRPFRALSALEAKRGSRTRKPAKLGRRS